MNELRARYYWDQLKRRKVVRVALVYIILALVVVQIGEVAFVELALPSWSLTLLTILVLSGFPIALALS